MAWTLGSITLPSVKGFRRDFVEKSIYHETINGKSRKDITSRKEKFFMTFTNLTQEQVSSLLSAHSAKTTLLFSAEDGSLSIAPRMVHVEVSQRNYSTKGSEFRENIDILLVDVDSNI